MDCCDKHKQLAQNKKVVTSVSKTVVYKEKTISLQINMWK